MVHRTMGFPHKAKPKSAYRVIWVQDILKCVGRMPVNGKRKGGIKMHTVIHVDERVPKMVWFTSAATHDH